MPLGYGLMLTPGSTIGLQLANVAPQTSTVLLIGVSQLGVPYKGAIVWPSPDLVLAGLVTDALGMVTVAGTWPAGIPSGTKVTAQYWMPAGFLASNGVTATVP